MIIDLLTFMFRGALEVAIIIEEERLRFQRRQAILALTQERNERQSILRQIDNNVRHSSILEMSNHSDESFIHEVCRAISRNPSITKVRFTNCAMGESCIQLLANNASLIVLMLNTCNLKSKHAEILSKSISIKHLDLTDNLVGSEGAVHLAKANIAVTFLNLSKNGIKDSGLLEFRKNRNIKFLFLDDNLITSRGTEGIAENESLYYLSLANNEVGDKGAYNISTCKTIGKLNLANNKITDTGASDLGRGIRAAYVWLGFNNIRNSGAVVLANNEFIIHLCLQSNLIGSDGAKAISESETIVTVNLEGNFIGSSSGISNLVLNKRLTSCKVNNRGLASSRDNTFPSLSDRIEWSASHSINTVRASSQNKLTSKIDENKMKSVKLALLCLNGTPGEVERFIIDEGAVPYGEYFNSLLQGSTSVLHLAVKKRDNMLLSKLIKVLPKSLLYYKENSYDGLTYEQYAEKTEFELTDDVQSNVVDPGRHNTQCNDGTDYAIMLNDKLRQMKTGAEAAAYNNAPAPHTVFQIIRFVPIYGAPVSAVLQGLYDRANKPHPTRICTWLREDYDLKKLVDELLTVQTDSIGRLRAEREPGNLQFLRNRLALVDAEGRQGRELSMPEKRAVLHIHKLCKFMSSVENRPVLSNEAWINRLMMEVMGDSYNITTSPQSILAHSHPQQNSQSINVSSNSNEIEILQGKVLALQAENKRLNERQGALLDVILNNEYGTASDLATVGSLTTNTFRPTVSSSSKATTITTNQSSASSNNILRSTQ